MLKPIFWSFMTCKDGVANHTLAEQMSFEFSMWSLTRPGRVNCGRTPRLRAGSGHHSTRLA
eukprot:8770670-Pyramimonas_sp.AAC.1